MPLKAIRTAWDTLCIMTRWLQMECYFLRRTQSRQINGRHIALLAWALPPNSNAGVYRPLSFIRYGTELGWRFHAFRGPVPKNQSEHGEELLAKLPIATKLYEVPTSTRNPSYRFSPQIDGGFRNALKNATYTIKTLKNDPPNVVVASGPPFHVFVAAYFVSKHFGVPLILDYRDEWTECPFDFVGADQQNRYWERRCLATAEAVLFTTQSHVDHQISCFPELRREKAHLVPNGWEQDDFVQLPEPDDAPAHSDLGSIHLAHVGSLAGHTPPNDFLNALDDLLRNQPDWRDRLTVHFVGRRSPEASKALESFGFKKNIQIVDHVGKREAASLMQQADCLLLIAESDLERYLPGKLFDYVASSRPILVFGHEGEASRTLQNLEVGALCQPGSGRRLGDCLAHLTNGHKNKSPEIVRTWLANHRRSTLAKSAFEIFTSVVASRT